MSGPWEKYQNSGESGPWQKYQGQPNNTPPSEDKGSYWGDVARNVIPDIGRMAVGLGQQIKEGAYDMPKRAIESGLQMASGTPYAQTPSGMQDAPFVENAPNMARSFLKPYAHPIDSFRQEPVNTALAWLPLAEGTVGAYNKARPMLANAADRGAISLGKKSMGFTKQFLNTEGKEINAENAVRSAYENKVITPGADAYDMRARAQALQDSASGRMNEILEGANVEPSRPVVGNAQNAQGQLLLPAPRQPGHYVGPENVGTEAYIPAYQGAKYEYKAAGEGPQYSATEGATARPVSTPERFNRKILKDVRRGKIGSDYPDPKIIASEPPLEAWLFDQTKAVEDINSLRPRSKNGTILRGGEYDAQNAVIDDAIDTINAHGNRPLNWDEANRLKTTLRGKTNYDATKSNTVNELKKSIAAKFKDNLDSQLGSSMEASGKSPSLFKKAKQNYGEAKNMLKGLQNRISSDASKGNFGMTDYIVGGVGTAFGGPGTGIGSVIAKKAVQRYGANTAGTGLFKASKAISSLPEIKSPALAVGSKVGLATNAVNSLSKDKAREYLKKAKGDKDLARKLAKADGWQF